MMQIQFEHRVLAEALNQFEEIVFCYLFGSAENGVIMENSDLDIAIYLTKKEYDIDLRLQVIKKLETIIPGLDKIDLIILNHSNSMLSMQAFQGKLLFIKGGFENLHSEIYSRICRQYEDDFFWIKKQLEYRGYEVQWSN